MVSWCQILATGFRDFLARKSLNKHGKRRYKNEGKG